MLGFLIWAVSVAVVFAGRSPNADYIDQLVASGGRYSNNILEDAWLDVPGLVVKYGYPSETHEVVTEDGYVLTMHRIPHGRDRNNQPDPNKPIVFLMHGLMSSSAEFVLKGPGNALGYRLAEEGYDVWMGNARGNYYSRRHTQLDPNNRLNPAFWRFSWDEIGNLDLPAFLDHIEATTGQARLHYIGHSQGCTSFLVLNALRPQYAGKFISFQALAPAAFFIHNESQLYATLLPHIDIIEAGAFALFRGEVFRNREWVTSFASNFCYEGSIFNRVCQTIVVNGIGMSDYFNQTMIPVFLGHSPAGASIRQFVHYGQSILQGTFRRYDHNAFTNLILYGSRTPPDYDLSRVTAPTHLHYSLSDDAAHWKDVEFLATKLPNAHLHKVNSPTFDHIDFVWSTRAVELVHELMLSLMRETETN